MAEAIPTGLREQILSQIPSMLKGQGLYIFRGLNREGTEPKTKLLSVEITWFQQTLLLDSGRDSTPRNFAWQGLAQPASSERWPKFLAEFRFPELRGLSLGQRQQRACAFLRATRLLCASPRTSRVRRGPSSLQSGHRKTGLSRAA